MYYFVPNPHGDDDGANHIVNVDDPPPNPAVENDGDDDGTNHIVDGGDPPPNPAIENDDSDDIDNLATVIVEERLKNQYRLIHTFLTGGNKISVYRMEAT